ncbi:hypothetical protein Pst134EB_003527 [Puccinia striiformis f. sp. tritici]|nr:hypothetical protein Pst134EB_003527 [Puccinia striiformis f. sp. tritici]
MRIISTKRFLCFLALHPFRAGSLVLSSLTVKQHAATDSAEMLQSAGPPKSSNAIVKKTPMKDTGQGTCFRISEQQYKAVKKAKVRALEIASEQLRRRIRSLETQSKPQLIQIKAHLEQLHQGLRPPFAERARQLYGLGPSMTELEFKINTPSKEPALSSTPSPSKSEVDSLQPVATKVFKGDQSPTITSQGKTSTRSSKAQRTQLFRWITGRRPRAKGKELVSIAEDPIDPGVVRPSNSEHSTTTGLEALSQSGSSTISHEPPTGGVANKASETNTSSYVMYGDVLGVVKEHMLTTEMKIWNSLQNALIGFQSQDDPSRVTDPKFKLAFLECLYLLGDLIHEHQLLPSYFIKSIEIFKPEIFFKMVQYNVDLLFNQWRGGFFGSPQYLMPRVEFLKTMQSVKHFHRSIKAFDPVKDHQHLAHLIHVVLSTIMRHAPWDEADSSARFIEIREGFTRSDFLKHADILSSRLSNKEPGQDSLANSETIQVVLLIKSLDTFFHDPARTMISNKEKLEYQITYYILKFIERYYRPIMDTMVPERQYDSLFQVKLSFMGGHQWVYNRNL